MSRGRGQSGPMMTLFAFQDVIMSVSGIMILIMLMLSLELITKTGKPAGAVAAETVQTLRAEIAAARVSQQTLESSLYSADQLVQVAAALTPEELRRNLAQAQSDIEAIETDVEGLARRQQHVEKALEAAAVEKFDQRPLEAELAALQDQGAELAEQVESETTDNRPVFSLPRGEPRDGWLVVISGDGISAAPLGRASVPLAFGGSQAVQDFVRWAAGQSSPGLYVLLLVRPSGVRKFDELQPELDERGISHGFDVVTEQQAVLHAERGAAP